MADERIDRILDMLKLFSERTANYLSPLNVETVHSYLNGLVIGCNLCGMEINSRSVFEQGLVARGWEDEVAGMTRQMRAKGLDDAAVIQELIAVYAETFRLLAKSGE